MRLIRNKMIAEYKIIAEKRMGLEFGSKEEKELGVIESTLLNKWGKLNDEIITLKNIKYEI